MVATSDANINKLFFIPEACNCRFELLYCLATDIVVQIPIRSLFLYKFYSKESYNSVTAQVGMLRKPENSTE